MVVGGEGEALFRGVRNGRPLLSWMGRRLGERAALELPEGRKQAGRHDGGRNTAPVEAQQFVEALVGATRFTAMDSEGRPISLPSANPLSALFD